ncbi:MAG: cell wall-binding repeat-containing protein [Anaerosomatales bacterium]|nr:cell wall-binding repeat-containing protein [Anaerosomatales bacterium]
MFRTRPRRFEVRALAALSVVAALLLVMLAPLSAIALESKLIAHVTVTDASTGEPIEGAWVDAFFVDPATGDEWWAGYADTGSDGTCMVPDEEGCGAGEYAICVEAYGYAWQRKTVVWNGQDPVAVDFALARSKAIADVSVTDADTGEPIEGAWVDAFFVDPATGDEWWTDSAYTGSDGACAVLDSEGYGAGQYVIYVEADGYFLQQRTVTWNGQDPVAVDFALARSKAIADVTVIDADTGAPIGGAYVVASFIDPVTRQQHWTSSAYTDAGGACVLYEQFNRGAGEYVISVDAEPYYPQQTTVEWDGRNPVAVDLALSCPKAIANVTVTDASTGKPVRFATVRAYYIESSTGAEWWVDSMWTDSKGACTLRDKPGRGAGQYAVYVSQSGYYYQREAVFWWDGLNPVDLSVAITPYRPIADVAVTDADTGKPVAGAQVEARLVDPATGAEWVAGYGWTDAEGKCTVVDANARGAGEYKICVDDYRYASQRTTMTWDGKNPVTVAFALSRPKVVANVTVTDAETGEPLDGVCVDAYFVDPATGSESLTSSAFTSSEGTCAVYDRFSHGAGEYRIIAYKYSYIEYVAQKKSVFWDGQNPVAIAIALPRLAADAYEPDDNAANAKPIAPGSVMQLRTLFPSGDADWVRVPVQAGKLYAFETVRWHRMVDTYLELYDSDGIKLLDADDNGKDHFYSHIEWVADATKTVYLKVRGSYGSMGPYGLAVARINRSPAAVPDAFTVSYDATVGIGAASGVLANDSDPDGDTLSATLVSGPSHGTLKLASDGGFVYVPEPGWSGTDCFVYRASDGEAFSEPATATIDVLPVASIPVEGSDRISTAIQASKLAFPDGADAVVIATAYNWPDALGGASLAGAAGGPVLLTPKDALPAAVASEVARLGAKKAYVLGGTGAVAAAVETALKAQLGDTNVERIWGLNRYETARKVAAKCVALLGAAYDGTAFVATGQNFPDALGASPAAAAKGWPIFLVDPRAGADAALVSAMQAAGVRKTIVLGGTGAVSDAVKADVARLVQCATDRWAGLDRYGTAATVAEKSAAAGLAWDGVGIATGENFPDALAAGPVLGKSGSVLLLTKTASLPEPTRLALSANKRDISAVRFFGGLGAVTQPVRDAALQALK